MLPTVVTMSAFLILGSAVHTGQLAAPAQQETAAAGLVVVVDPATRQVRAATPAEIAAIAQQRAPLPAAAPPPVIRGPNGAVGMVLGPEFQMYTVVTTGPDGKMRVQEVGGDAKSLETPDAR